MEEESIPWIMLSGILISFILALFMASFRYLIPIAGFCLSLSMAFSWTALASAFFFKSSISLKVTATLIVVLEILLIVLYRIPNNGPYGI